jgi:hypothetical protein
MFDPVYLSFLSILTAPGNFYFGQRVNLSIIQEFDSPFSGKNPIIEIPNDQNHGWYTLFDPYEFATHMVWHRWFLAARVVRGIFDSSYRQARAFMKGLISPLK